MHMRKRVGDSVSDMERSLPNILGGKASESKEVKDIIPEKMLMPLEDGEYFTSSLQKSMLLGF